MADTVVASTLASPGPSGVLVQTCSVVSASGNQVSTRVMTPLRPSLSSTGFRDAIRAYMVRTRLMGLVCSSSRRLASLLTIPGHDLARDGRMVEKLQAISLGIARVEAAGPVAMGARGGVELHAALRQVGRPVVHVLGPAHQEPDVVETGFGPPGRPGVQSQVVLAPRHVKLVLGRPPLDLVAEHVAVEALHHWQVRATQRNVADPSRRGRRCCHAPTILPLGPSGP